MIHHLVWLTELLSSFGIQNCQVTLQLEKDLPQHSCPIYYRKDCLVEPIPASLIKRQQFSSQLLSCRQGLISDRLALCWCCIYLPVGIIAACRWSLCLACDRFAFVVIVLSWRSSVFRFGLLRLFVFAGRFCRSSGLLARRLSTLFGL